MELNNIELGEYSDDSNDSDYSPSNGTDEYNIVSMKRKRKVMKGKKRKNKGNSNKKGVKKTKIVKNTNSRQSLVVGVDKQVPKNKGNQKDTVTQQKQLAQVSMLCGCGWVARLMLICVC